jgi:hypothetical protein
MHVSVLALALVADGVAVACFVIRWMPAAPRPALAVIALQLVLAATPTLTVTFLEAWA